MVTVLVRRPAAGKKLSPVAADGSLIARRAEFSAVARKSVYGQ